MSGLCANKRRSSSFLLFALLLAIPSLMQAASSPLDTDELALAIVPFDRAIESFVKARQVPGAALAVVKDRRLVYAKGYGWADREDQVPACPDSLFRIASLSKPITAVAILKLVEEGRLRLDDRAFEILGLSPFLSSDSLSDLRLKSITIRHLLNHTGGWDSRKSFDPMFRSTLIAKTVGVPSPADPPAIIRYMLGQQLDFDPGARYAYSNFGYCVLGRVIEKLADASYENYVKQHVLAPIGITRMRIGASLKTKKTENEVCYYTLRNRQVPSVFFDASGQVPLQYGGFCLEAMDSHGGWLASAVDLARFAAALDDPQNSPLLKPETFKTMYARPDAPVWRNSDGSLRDYYYACGWLVRPVGKNGRANYWHTGSIPGTYTLLVRRWDGLDWVALFNQRSDDRELPDSAIDPALHRAADSVVNWPSRDLFHHFK